jgi:hypothetical protein
MSMILRFGLLMELLNSCMFCCCHIKGKNDDNNKRTKKVKKKIV